MRTWIARLQDGSIANPFKIIYVDPSEITRVSRFNAKRYAGRVLDEDWDQTDRQFEKMTTYIGLRERYEEGKPWKETVYYEDAVKRISENGHLYGCWSPQEFLDVRCAYLDNLYETIESDGYRTQSEISSEDRARHRHSTVKSFHEVSVSIGRDGSYLFDRGKHRLSIAKLLNLEEIPVQVIVRHDQWQKRRRKIYQRDQYNGRIDPHEDLADILSGDNYE